MSNSGEGMDFFFSLNSMEMTGGVVSERQGSIHHIQQAAKIVTSQIHVPDASIRPTTSAGQNEKDGLQ